MALYPAHRLSLIAAAVGVIAVVALAGTGCSAPPESASDDTGRLADVEVQQYEGKRLGSIADFRENSIKGPQEVDVATYRLKVVGEVADPLDLTYDEVLDRPSYEKVVRLNCVEGWSVDILWEGVLIEDLLEQASYDEAAKVVIFRCEDGYSTSLPLDYVLERDILLASKMNGLDLPAERGYPFQVAAEDKWGYKWAKWVTSIEVSDNEAYEGYWEQRGYDNEADLPSAK